MEESKSVYGKVIYFIQRPGGRPRGEHEVAQCPYQSFFYYR